MGRKRINNMANKLKILFVRAQKCLMKSAAPVCMELFTAVFFFGHVGATLVEQADTCGLATRFREYVQTEAPYAAQAPAMNYESLYK